MKSSGLLFSTSEISFAFVLQRGTECKVVNCVVLRSVVKGWAAGGEGGESQRRGGERGRVRDKGGMLGCWGYIVIL